MNEWAIFFPLLAVGLVSSAHCIGMCGGIMGALSMAIPANAGPKRWAILFAYNIGRLISYSLMGFLAGIVTAQLSVLGGGSLLRVVAGMLLVAMGFYLADWWRGLRYLEAIGRYLWIYIQPFGKRLLPVTQVSQALLLGAIWGWLPCGLVYSALALAIAQPSPLVAAGAMLAFGLGTLPAVLAAGVTAQTLTGVLQRRKVRIVLAVLIIVYGFWTIYAGLDFGVFSGHHHHIH